MLRLCRFGSPIPTPSAETEPVGRLATATTGRTFSLLWLGESTIESSMDLRTEDPKPSFWCRRGALMGVSLWVAGAMERGETLEATLLPRAERGREEGVGIREAVAAWRFQSAASCCLLCSRRGVSAN